MKKLKGYPTLLRNKILERLKKSNFVCVEIIGPQGSGKTVLIQRLLERFTDYDISWDGIHYLNYPSKNTIKIFDDYHFKIMNENSCEQRFISRAITSCDVERHFNFKLIHIVVGNRQAIDPKNLIVTVGSSIPYHTPFRIALRNAYAGKTKSRPYLVGHWSMGRFTKLKTRKRNK